MRMQIVWLVAVALGLRLAVAFSALPGPVMDETGYDDSGWALAQGQGYVMNGRLAYKAPLYSVFLAGIYQVAGHDYRAVRVVQAFGGVLLCLGVVWLGHLLFTEAVGWLAGWLMAIHPLLVLLTGRLLSEGLYTWLLTAAVLGWVLLFRAPTVWKGICVGAGCGVLTLTRSLGVGLAFVIAGATLAARPWKTPMAFRQRVGFALLILIGWGTIVAPWTARNWFRLHAFVPISTEGGRAFYGSWVTSPSDKVLGFNPVNETTQYAEKIPSEVERDRFLFLKTIQHLAIHPSEGVRLTLWKALLFWCPFDWEITASTGIYQGLFVAILPLAALGVKDAAASFPGALWVLLPPMIFTYLGSVLFAGLPRFRLPIEPFLILLGSVGLWNRRRLKFSWFWMALNILGIFYSAQLKELFKTAASILGIW